MAESIEKGETPHRAAYREEDRPVSEIASDPQARADDDNAAARLPDPSRGAAPERGRSSLFGTRGILPIKMVRIAAFAVISISIFACAVLCLLAVWDFASGDTAWRAFASLGIIAGAVLSFVVVNEAFGASLRD